MKTYASRQDVSFRVIVGAEKVTDKELKTLIRDCKKRYRMR